jgi:hypothetical protein
MTAERTSSSINVKTKSNSDVSSGMLTDVQHNTPSLLTAKSKQGLQLRDAQRLIKRKLPCRVPYLSFPY